ncbi:MAG: hypothetical protein E6Q25_03860 [Acinetobacter sp.]|nr:MAG: hypothetical protein E6Q25_03860 [Acinetobacter sp.]
MNMYITLHYITLHYIFFITKEQLMKKLIALAAAMISVNAFAENNTSLRIDRVSVPPAMIEQIVPVQEQQQFTVVQNEPVSQVQSYQKPSQFSIAAGYSGSNLSDSDGVKEKGKGFFVNGAYHFDNSSNFWIELDKQKSSDIYDEFSYMGYDVSAKTSFDLTEIAFGAQYKWNGDRLYEGIVTGLGFARSNHSMAASITQKGKVYTESDSESFDYYTWRIADLELGAKITPNFSVFADVGYKLLLSLETDTVCGYAYCVSGRAEDMDLDGVTYKAGLRYKF